MKSYNIIVYLNIILFNKVIYALSIENIDPTKISVSKNISKINLSDLAGLVIKGLPDFSKFQCPPENSDCEDIYLPFPKLVKKYGYPVEEHEVKTADGYLLTMFRIPNEGPAVLLIHGGTSNCCDYVTMGTQAGPAYLLADAGYDVWLANCRGNKFSMRHVSLSTDSAAFWDFTWHEIGIFDLAAMIDHIILKTNAIDIKVIAVSQATNEILTLVSEKPVYNDKISVIILLAPTSFLGHAISPLIKLLTAPIVPDIYQLGKLVGLYSLNSQMEIGPYVDLLKSTFCATPETASAICHNILFLFFGSDYEQVNKTSLPVIYGHYPDAISIKMVQHFLQIWKSGQFRQYDHGEDINLLKYGSRIPPEYPLDKIRTKVAICWAENDILHSDEDHQILLSKLPNVIDVYKVPHERFNHPDFVFAKDLKTLLYDKVFELLNAN